MYYDKLKARLEAAELAAKNSQVKPEPVTDHIAPVYLPIHEDIQANGHQYYNLPGGRGSCKSSFVSLEMVDGIMGDETGESNGIIFRRVAASLRDSVFSQIQWAVDTLGAAALWRSSVNPMKFVYTPTGAEILFKGLDDPSKLKSIKPKKGVFRFVWLEEFSELPGANFQRNVMQSVLRGGEDFVVFRSFNPPISANNWANKFVAEPDPRALTLLTNYTQIPPEWLGEGFLYEAQRLKELHPRAYANEYMGEATGTGGEVFPSLEIRTITDEEISNMGYIYQGLDFGFAVDPACFIRSSYDRKTETVYILDEIFKRGMSNKAMADAIKEKGYDKTGRGYVSALFGGVYYGESQTIICDAAEPKSIQDMRNEGLQARKCHKSPGCVQYRIKWLQRRKIVIDPARTPNAYREFVAYEYAVDRDGNYLPDLPDRENHSIDSLAYSLNDIIFYTKGQTA